MENHTTVHNVLVIAYYFPPLGLSGVQRTLKFVKYLPQFGWHPTVLTVESRGYFAKDEKLLEELENLPVDIIRTKSIDPLHYLRASDIVRMPSSKKYALISKLSQCFFIPDNKIGWKKFALQKAREIIHQKKIDVIYATAPPYTDFLIGTQLKKEFGIPFVVDYRDAWIENPLHVYLTPFHKMRHVHLEKRVLQRADRIITINRRIKELLLTRYENLTHHEIDIIPQGFDQEDFNNNQKIKSDNKFRITHSGTFYYNRTPKYFLRALNTFLINHPQARTNIEACFVGNFHSENEKLIRELKLEENVKLYGYVPHDESIKILQQSDVLWMMLGNSPGDDMMSTGKLFEYLGSRKPIFGCVPDGVAKKTIQQCGAGFIASPHNIQETAATIETLYSLYQTNSLPKIRDEYVKQFDRKLLTGQLAKIFSSLLEADTSDVNIRPEY